MRTSSAAELQIFGMRVWAGLGTRRRSSPGTTPTPEHERASVLAQRHRDVPPSVRPRAAVGDLGDYDDFSRASPKPSCLGYRSQLEKSRWRRGRKELCQSPCTLCILCITPLAAAQFAASFRFGRSDPAEDIGTCNSASNLVSRLTLYLSRATVQVKVFKCLSDACSEQKCLWDYCQNPAFSSPSASPFLAEASTCSEAIRSREASETGSSLPRHLILTDASETPRLQFSRPLPSPRTGRHGEVLHVSNLASSARSAR